MTAKNRKAFKLNEVQRYDAAQAWQQGGYMMLSSWLAREYPHYTSEQYAVAVLAAREELNDWTDYSQENSQ